MPIFTFQDKLDVLAAPTGLRWTSWWRYDPLNRGELWVPLADGNSGSYATIVFVAGAVPAAGSTLRANYQLAAVAAHSHAWSETPVGAIDGVNPTFTLAAAPTPPESLLLWRNNILQTQGAANDYVVVGNVVTFNVGAIPAVGNVLTAFYQFAPGAGHSHVWNEIPAGAIDGVNPTFTLAAVPSAPLYLLLWRNGMFQRQAVGDDYTIVGNVVTFNAGNIPPAGSWLLASYGVAAAVGHSHAWGETPVGIVDGANPNFHTVGLPTPANSLLLFRNGILQRAGGNDFDQGVAGATVLNADGSFIREYEADLVEGTLVFKMVLKNTTEEKTRGPNEFWHVEAGVLVNVTMVTLPIGWRVGGGYMLNGVQRFVMTLPQRWF